MGLETWLLGTAAYWSHALFHLCLYIHQCLFMKLCANASAYMFRTPIVSWWDVPLNAMNWLSLPTKSDLTHTSLGISETHHALFVMILYKKTFFPDKWQNVQCLFRVIMDCYVVLFCSALFFNTANLLGRKTRQMTKQLSHHCSTQNS